MGKSRKRRTFRPPRKPLNLGDTTRTVTFYVVRFMTKVPAELREGTDAPEWIKRESPPTLDEHEAVAAYKELIPELDTLGLKSPQLLRRTVTEDILFDHDETTGASPWAHMDTETPAVTEEPDDAAVNQALDALAAEAFTE